MGRKWTVKGKKFCVTKCVVLIFFPRVVLEWNHLFVFIRVEVRVINFDLQLPVLKLQLSMTLLNLYRSK